MSDQTTPDQTTTEPASAVESTIAEIKTVETKPADLKAEPKGEAAPAEAVASSAIEKLAITVATAEALAAAAQAGDKTAASAPAPGDPGSRLPRHLPLAAGIVVALGLGWAAGSQLNARQDAIPAWAAEIVGNQRRGQEEAQRFAGDLQSLRANLDAMRAASQRATVETRALPAAVEAKLERAERAAVEASATAVKAAAQIERLEKASLDNGRLAPVLDRLDRLEKQITDRLITAAAAKAVPVAAVVEAPTQTGALSPKKEVEAKAEPKSEPKADQKLADPRQVPLEGWVLREVYDGVALVENRSRGLHEVGPGHNLPGGVKVEAIERRGRAWIVITSKGTIGMERWW
ncbi:MAG TPA: hypothetical protein VIL65_16295 [Beijerinckiaceae bacterium]|jgi:hypothetical protein